jgi:hypothetical protein
VITWSRKDVAQIVDHSTDIVGATKDIGHKENAAIHNKRAQLSLFLAYLTPPNKPKTHPPNLERPQTKKDK